MKRISFVAIVGVSTFVLALPVSARAQYQLSGSARVGVAKESVAGYGNASNFVYDLALDLLAPPIGSTRFTLGAEYTAGPASDEQVTATNPGGFTYPPAAPNFNFLAATAGVREQAGPFVLDLSVALGSVNVVKEHTHAGVAGAGSMALPIGGAWHFVVRASALRWTQSGTTIYAYPVMIGLQVN